MCPVECVREGSEVEIVRLAGGERFCRRLAEIGVVPGARVRVVRNARGGILLGVGDARYALGEGMCGRIFVQEVSESAVV
jgi:ferrous iron transport protein A